MLSTKKKSKIQEKKNNTLLTKKKNKIQEKKKKENKITAKKKKLRNQDLTMLSSEKKESFKIILFSFLNSHLW